MGRNAIVVCGGLLAAITGIAILALMGPKLKMFNRLTLKTQIDQTASEGGGWHKDGTVEFDYSKLIGKTGKAVTVLRPIGKAEIDGDTFQVETGGSFINVGAEIKVARVQGNTIIVRSV
jgi:membrane-bound serine protease (ClpP class)